MSKEDREKELKRLIWIKSQIINQSRKEIKAYHQEIDQINGYKKLERKKENGRTTRKN